MPLTRHPDADPTDKLVYHAVDIASALLFLSCPLSRHITGQTLAVDGGDLVKYPHDVSAPPLPPGKAMGDAPMPGHAS